jgi:hypothetical protein
VTIRDGKVDMALPDVSGLAAATKPEPMSACSGLARAPDVAGAQIVAR